MRCFRSRQHKALIEGPEFASARKPGVADAWQNQAIGSNVDGVARISLEIRMRMIAEPRLLGEQRRGPDLRDVDHLTDLQPAKDDVEIGAVSVDGPSAIVCFADSRNHPKKRNRSPRPTPQPSRWVCAASV
jgi:hypothetical protein